jgi:DNA-binding beta-propeller fold protein YncE
MRTRLRKALTALIILSGPAALFVFSQLGGDVAPLRRVQDPYPVFTDIAVDPEANILAVTDENRFSVRTYDRNLASNAVADPRSVITGTRTGIDFVCGVAVDSVNKEIYAANNDTDSDVMVFKYDAQGNVPPARSLTTASTGTWGVALDLTNNEVAVTVQHVNKVAVYRRQAKDDDKPLRIIQGPGTGLADPHGVFVDAPNNELFVANHDSYHEVPTDAVDRNAATAAIARGTARPEDLAIARRDLRPSNGKFVEPSIAVYSRTAQGDAAPRRVIRGPRTELSLPMKVFVDTVHNELFVANSGGNSILVFSRTANGDTAPIRKIQGPATGLKKPVGLFVDTKNDEVWATNPEEHSAMAYRRTAQGNAAPLRTLRGAPQGTPAPGIGNPGGIAYDPLREQILVPN